MADKIEEEHLDDSMDSQTESHSDEIIPAQDAKNINQNKETENMEVHKHPHHVTHKKKWTEYFLEFFMIFLAVFLGFLAEYQLEHVIEKDREKEYMVTLLEDLKADRPLLVLTEKEWDESNTSADSVAAAITFPLATANLTKVYRHLNGSLNCWSFKYNDRTITQLKNAGGFRLLRNKKVANEIIAYDQFYNNAMVNIAAQHDSFWATLVQLRNKVFIQEITSKIYSQYEYKPVPLSANPWIADMIAKNKLPMQAETEAALLFEFKNAMLSYRQDYTSNMKWGYDKLLKKQQELITLISREYNLEKE